MGKQYSLGAGAGGKSTAEHLSQRLQVRPHEPPCCPVLHWRVVVRRIVLFRQWMCAEHRRAAKPPPLSSFVMCYLFLH